MPCAFVTGGTGFLGLNLLEQLGAAGWQITALHRPTSGVWEKWGLGPSAARRTRS